MKKSSMHLLFTEKEIAQRVQLLAARISADYQDGDLVLVGVLKGAFIFLADLVRQLSIPAEVDFVRLGSYGGSTVSSKDVRIIADIESDLQDRDVLIVEDIVDSGRTIEFLCKHLLAQKPRSLKVCTLLDKQERRELNVPIDYAALQLDRGFVVGYGLDCKEKGRHFSDIREVFL